MNKQKLLKLSDADLDSAVKIAGTDYDRRRYVTEKDFKHICKALSKKETVSDLAKILGVSKYTINYNANPEFRDKELERKKLQYEVRKACNLVGKKPNDFAERVQYKRFLVGINAKLKKWVD